MTPVPEVGRVWPDPGHCTWTLPNGHKVVKADFRILMIFWFSFFFPYFLILASDFQGRVWIYQREHVIVTSSCRAFSLVDFLSSSLWSSITLSPQPSSRHCSHGVDTSVLILCGLVCSSSVTSWWDVMYKLCSAPLSLNTVESFPVALCTPLKVFDAWARYVLPFVWVFLSFFLQYLIVFHVQVFYVPGKIYS